MKDINWTRVLYTRGQRYCTNCNSYMSHKNRDAKRALSRFVLPPPKSLEEERLQPNRMQRIPRRKLQAWGWVYVIECPYVGYVSCKIGWTQNLSSRLAQHQCSHHVEIRYSSFFTVRGNFVEKLIHSKLRPVWQRGEHFALTPEAAFVLIADFTKDYLHIGDDYATHAQEIGPDEDHSRAGVATENGALLTAADESVLRLETLSEQAAESESDFVSETDDDGGGC